MSSWLELGSSSEALDLALKSAVVMLLAASVVAALGRASAAWRHLAWFLSVASLLILPALCPSLPTWRVSWLPGWSAAPDSFVAVERTAPLRVEPDMPLAAEPTTIIARAPSPPDETASGELGPQPAAAASILAATGGASAWGWLGAVWIAGGILSLVPLAAGLGQLAVMQRRSRVVDDERWRGLLDELRRTVGVSREVQLRQGDSGSSPFTWGALRPVLFVPAESETWSEERRRLVLLHELAHVRRWDWLTQLAAHVACALYWFNPLVWFAARRMRIERERACDDLVLASGARASDYARELLAIAAGLSPARLSTLAAVPMARSGSLEDRLRGVLDSRRSRTALTTATVCFTALLAAAVLAPLAMLRAAPPEPPQPESPAPEKYPAAEKANAVTQTIAGQSADQPAPQKSVDRSQAISIRVMNAKGDRGIPEFRVIAGVSSEGVATEFEKRTGKTVVSWQPHTCRIGKNGGYLWPLDQAYAEMALRVEADGYQPQVFAGIKKSKGAQQLVFLLAEDPGIAGRVLTPDGRPAADATVALSMPQQEIVWEGGKLRGADQPLPDKPGDRWRRPSFVQTDAAGAFRLRTEIEPAAVLLVHESGVREMAYDEWKKAPEVTLQPWGRVAGQVLWQDQPGADEEISLTVHRDEYGYPGMIASYATIRTGRDGKFNFDRVLPGRVQISRPINLVDPNKPNEPAGQNAAGISSVILNGMFRHVQVTPGAATPVLLGGQGRQVTGKFIGLDSWEGATYHLHPEAPHFGRGGDDASWTAFSRLKASSIGPRLFRDRQPVKPDGTFTIDKVLPGRYQLFLSAPGFRSYVASTRFDVAPETPGEAPAPLALKEIATSKQPAEAPPPAAKPFEKIQAKPAEKPVVKPAAKTTTIRGKVLDDVTGEPIERLITQGGKFEPADPTKVTWGYSEGRSSSRDGSFSTTVRWGDGWTARILADGYIPQPLITSAPPADKDELTVVIRLKRGPKVRGIALDHAGRPVKGAAIFAVGPTGMNLSGGRAVSGYGGGSDDVVHPARTDAEGRFELLIGEAKMLAVSHVGLDAWSAEIPAQGELTIRLPAPARVEVELDILGAAKESTIFYQFLTEGRPEFKGVRLEQDVKVANPGKLTLAALPPGRYQLCRTVMNNLGEVGMGAMLEREFFELKAGETKVIRLVRDQGARVRGQVTWPADTKLMGTVISVRSLTDRKNAFDDHEWPVVYASQAAAKDGTFHTERLRPGKYLLVAEAYLPLTPEQRVRSGILGPSYRAQATVDVPADGELKVEDLVLRPTPLGK